MPASQSQSTKGNPASHRMSNAKRKANRASRWAKARRRRDEHKAREAEAAKRNRMLRERGDLTPWQVAKAARAARREAQRAA